jgi:hypothetical protein
VMKLLAEEDDKDMLTVNYGSEVLGCTAEAKEILGAGTKRNTHNGTCTWYKE